MPQDSDTNASGGAGNVAPLIATGGAQSASTVRIVSSERAMKPYAVFPTEILALTRTSALSSLFFAFAAGLATLAFRLWSESGNVTSITGASIGGFICAAVGVWANSWRNQIIRMIEDESAGVQTERTASAGFLDSLKARIGWR